MTASNDRFTNKGILLNRVIACPVCGEKAHSFRIRKVSKLRTVDMPAAMDLLRLAVEYAV
jgi:hypothetical protein